MLIKHEIRGDQVGGTIQSVLPVSVSKLCVCVCVCQWVINKGCEAVKPCEESADLSGGVCVNRFLRCTANTGTENEQRK